MKRSIPLLLALLLTLSLTACGNPKEAVPDEPPVTALTGEIVTEDGEKLGAVRLTPEAIQFELTDEAGDEWKDMAKSLYKVHADGTDEHMPGKIVDGAAETHFSVEFDKAVDLTDVTALMIEDHLVPLS